MKTKATDLELISLAIDNDQKAYAELLERYRRAVYFLILKIVKNAEDVEDLTYVTFTKAFKNLHRYEPTHGFSTWLFKIASNSAIDFLRKKRIDTVGISMGGDFEPGEVVLDNKVVAYTLNPEDKFIKDQRMEIVQHVVRHLDVDFEKVIRLRFFEEYSYDEIATELNLPLGTVKVQIHRAKKILHSILKDSSDKF
ncbi:MAG TPA: sigma-70 family RNA polymerase sigma factor [Chitinophagales bacterium]|nr:sigma-70 family RNA polymerase sigma factor [Chitinophagales bacterium]